jgi:hypothetical protein
MGNNHSKKQASKQIPCQYYNQYHNPYPTQLNPEQIVGTVEYIANRRELCVKTIKKIEEDLVIYSEKNIDNYKESIQNAKIFAENNKLLFDEYNELKKSNAIVNIDQLQKYTQEGILENQIMLDICSKFLEKINKCIGEYHLLSQYYNDWHRVNKNTAEIYNNIDQLIEYYNDRPVIHTTEITAQIQQLLDKMATIQSSIIESGISELDTLWKNCMSPISVNYGVKLNCNKLIKNITTIKDMIKLIDLETQEFI